LDGKGRALDNIAIERFWRTLKYGEIYLKEYESIEEAKNGIDRFIKKYNSFRPYTAHGIKYRMRSIMQWHRHKSN
jgi:putative transposase